METRVSLKYFVNGCRSTELLLLFSIISPCMELLEKKFPAILNTKNANRVQKEFF